MRRCSRNNRNSRKNCTEEGAGVRLSGRLFTGGMTEILVEFVLWVSRDEERRPPWATVNVAAGISGRIAMDEESRIDWTRRPAFSEGSKAMSK
jgi:hypothetical protein